MIAKDLWHLIHLLLDADSARPLKTLLEEQNLYLNRKNL